MENEMLIGMVQLDTNMKEDVAKRLIDQQVAPLMENIPNHCLRVDSATRQFCSFCHRHWHELKVKSKTEGKVFAPLIQLVTDFEGEAWLVRYMDGQVDKLQLKFVSDGWSDGKLDFMPNVGHIKRYGRLLF